MKRAKSLVISACFSEGYVLANNLNDIRTRSDFFQLRSRERRRQIRYPLREMKYRQARLVSLAQDEIKKHMKPGMVHC